MTSKKRPSVEEIEYELKRRKSRSVYVKAFRGTVWILVVVAAVSIICSTFFISVLEIQGGSMEPTLYDREMVIVEKTNNFESGDIVAFYYNNKILLKRVIGTAGDWIDINREGDVTVNGVLLDEPYAKNKTLGECYVTFPYQVPEGRIFVLGDHRDVSIDSRNKAIGMIAKEQIEGKVIFRIWPLNKISPLN